MGKKSEFMDTSRHPYDLRCEYEEMKARKIIGANSRRYDLRLKDLRTHGAEKASESPDRVVKISFLLGHREPGRREIAAERFPL